MDLNNIIKQQIELIENGKPLEAFSKFFSDNVIMRNNDILFANNKNEGMKLQAEFIKNISEFKAIVYYSRLNNQTSTIGINYSYKNNENILINFKGMHKQNWENELVVTEDFYTDDYLDFSEFEKGNLTKKLLPTKN